MVHAYSLEEIRTLQYLTKLLFNNLNYVTLTTFEKSEVEFKLAILQSALNEFSFSHLLSNYQQCLTDTTKLVNYK